MCALMLEKQVGPISHWHDISDHLEIVMFGRGFYIKLVKFLIFAIVYLVFVYLYFFLAQLTHTEKLPLNKIGKVQEVVDKSDDTVVDNSDFALDENPVKDEFKGIESKIVAFDKQAEPFQGADKEEQDDSKQLIKAVEEIEENKKQNVANLEEESQDEDWHEEWVLFET